MWPALFAIILVGILYYSQSLPTLLYGSISSLFLGLIIMFVSGFLMILIANAYST